MTDWREVWQRLRRGEHVVLLGKGPFPAPDAAQLRLVTVDGAASSAPRRALDRACELLRPLHRGGSAALLDLAADRLRAGLRQHLLGEPAAPAELARYQLLSRPVAGEPPTALFLRSVDRADEASLRLLEQLLTRSAEPHLPLLLSFDSSEPTGPARRLLEQLRRHLPHDAFWSPEAQSPPGVGAATAAMLPWASPAALRVLRAAATVGERFESAVLAQLLGQDELEVLATLQEAVDRGLAIEDRGGGLFRFDPGVATALRGSTLPSLARAWHERLAQLFGGPPAPLTAGTVLAPAANSNEPSRAPAGSSVAQTAVAEPGPLRSETAGSAARELLEHSAAPSEWRDPRPAAWWQRLDEGLAPEYQPVDSATTPLTAAGGVEAQPASADVAAPPELGAQRDAQRAAGHAEAAGQWVTACAQHLAAAEQASLSGAHAEALQHAARAATLAANLPDAEERRCVQVTALLLGGRARWQCAPGGEASSLGAAIASLLECRERMRETDPAEMRAELAALLAHVQYDVGTPAALELALRELTSASQLMLEAGRPLDAARLLNDEAAVWVRLGDPVRAHHLLSRSREVFGKVIASHPAAPAELAETEHLLARLLLQAPARPGRERDAWQLGLEHGRAAEEAYRGFGDQQNLGRVWETLARLHLRLGQLEAAAQLLEDARASQRQLGDGVGLARSSAAAADLLVARHDYAHALDLLAESIRLNSEKGLRGGLEANRGRLRELGEQLPSPLADTRRALEQRIERALGESVGLSY